tara:strand:+ start:8950 stop:10338 length:1389 start_codon:yes stop_codon:yes gene_type:complete
MTLNPYFLQGSSGEQNLVQSLINEQLKIYGVEIFYIPRRYITKNTVIQEVIESKFQEAIPIEAYVDTFDGYEGQGSLLSKFGVQPLDDLTLIISKDRFENYITPLIKNIPNIELATRPKEGDLIYFPLGDRLFEIKFVEHEKPFYQLKKNYVYELRCELFRYEDSVVDTGVGDIDDNLEKAGYIETLTLVASGTAAVLTTGIVDGGVSFVTISNRGEDFTSLPRVAISSAPAGGITAVGIASMVDNIVDYDGVKSSKIQRIDIINPGAGYTVAPSIVVVGGGGAGFAATATINDGTLGVVTFTGGSGYSTAPTITFSAPSGTGTTATAIAYMGSGDNVGIVTQIGITNGGSGYTSAPTATVTAPYTGGQGNYIFNEVVTGAASSSTGRVKSWDASTLELKVSIATGSFINGEVITGSESGATYQYQISSGTNVDDGFAENTPIQTAADDIIDFTTTNPFGMP